MFLVFFLLYYVFGSLRVFVLTILFCFLYSCFSVALLDYQVSFLLLCCIYVMYSRSLFSCSRSFLFYLLFLYYFFACVYIYIYIYPTALRASPATVPAKVTLNRKKGILPVSCTPPTAFFSVLLALGEATAILFLTFDCKNLGSCTLYSGEILYFF